MYGGRITIWQSSSKYSTIRFTQDIIGGKAVIELESAPQSTEKFQDMSFLTSKLFKVKMSFNFTFLFHSHFGLKDHFLKDPFLLLQFLQLDFHWDVAFIYTCHDYTKTP